MGASVISTNRILEEAEAFAYAGNQTRRREID
jgi:hypothetical protein